MRSTSCWFREMATPPAVHTVMRKRSHVSSGPSSLMKFTNLRKRDEATHLSGVFASVPSSSYACFRSSLVLFRAYL